MMLSGPRWCSTLRTTRTSNLSNRSTRWHRMATRSSRVPTTPSPMGITKSLQQVHHPNPFPFPALTSPTSLVRPTPLGVRHRLTTHDLLHARVGRTPGPPGAAAKRRRRPMNIMSQSSARLLQPQIPKSPKSRTRRSHESHDSH